MRSMHNRRQEVAFAAASPSPFSSPSMRLADGLLLPTFSINNLFEFAEAYGAQAADTMAAGVYQWLVLCAGEDGVVSWAEAAAAQPHQINIAIGLGQTVLRDLHTLKPGVVKNIATFLRGASGQGGQMAEEELRHLVELARSRERSVGLEGAATQQMPEIAMRIGAEWLQGFDVAPPPPTAPAAGPFAGDHG